MKKVVIITLVVLALIAIGCVQESVTRDTVAVDDQQKIYRINQPIPKFDWSQDRSVLIQIYMAKNQARNTYSIITSQGTGELVAQCPSVGYPLAADTQLTNPLQKLNSYESVVEQAEPNGLYSSKNTDATYVLCVRKNGDIAPVYTEQKVTTFPYPVKLVNGAWVEVEDSPSTIKLDLKQGR